MNFFWKKSLLDTSMFKSLSSFISFSNNHSYSFLFAQIFVISLCDFYLMKMLYLVFSCDMDVMFTYEKYNLMKQKSVFHLLKIFFKVFCAVKLRC